MIFQTVRGIIISYLVSFLTFQLLSKHTETAPVKFKISNTFIVRLNFSVEAEITSMLIVWFYHFCFEILKSESKIWPNYCKLFRYWHNFHRLCKTTMDGGLQLKCIPPLLLLVVHATRATFVQNIYKKIEPGQNITGTIGATYRASVIDCSRRWVDSDLIYLINL